MADKKIPTYKSRTLVNQIAQTIRNKSDVKYCFILGAGASKSSGIRTGTELSEVWHKEVVDLFDDHESWIRENGVDKSNLDASYSRLYQKRFELSPEQGYEFLEKEMADKTPSFGYSILVRLIQENHNVVITTNFDSLVEDSLFLYSQKKPLICGHESLTEFVRLGSNRPTIIKVHRDLLFKPKNTDKELKQLESGFVESLDKVFQAYTPIVIGYGGNDPSLMGYLNSCQFLKNIFWCTRDKQELSDDIIELLSAKNGTIFEIAGFDDLMFQIYAELFKDEQLNQLLIDEAAKRANDWGTQLAELSKVITDTESKKSLAKITKDKDYKSWWDVELAVEAATDADSKNRIFLYGLSKFADSPELNVNYALFLQSIRKDYDNAEKYYLKALDLDPNHPIINGNYAVFLQSIRKDYDNVEKYYQKALALNPDRAINNGNYANFLQNIRKDHDNAEKYYKKALDLDPNHANNNGNYAQLLIAQGRHTEAKKLIDKSLSLADRVTQPWLLAELWLYRFASFYKEYPQAEKELKMLIADSITSDNWDFSSNIADACEKKHPKLDRVIEYAEKISGRKY